MSQPEDIMQPVTLWTDQLLTDRSTSLFRALETHQLAFDEYAQLVEEVLEPDLAFFLKNTFISLALAEGGD